MRPPPTANTRQTKYKQSKAEANNAQNTLQKEITTLRDAQRSLQLMLRDIEVQNDDFERQTRNQTSSLEDIESKYNVAIEREVMLEEEIKIGEREREHLRIETQRLRDELSDLRIEADIVQEKLRLAEATIDVHNQRKVSNHLASELMRPRSPISEASTTTTTLSSPTNASTPPHSRPHARRPDSTPPSPPLSDAPIAFKPVPSTPIHVRKTSIARDPSATPRAGTFSARQRHTRGPSISAAAPPSGTPTGRRTPSFMRTTASSAQKPSRPSLGTNETGQGMPRSGSLYQIRGLIGKMQKLEERVHSARSKLPAPMSPPRASPRTTSAMGNHNVPNSVTVRSNRKRTSQASSTASSVQEVASGISQLSFGASDSSRPGSRASIPTSPALSRSSSRTPVRTPLGHYPSQSIGRIEKRPPRPRTSMSGPPSTHHTHGYSQSFSMSLRGSDTGSNSDGSSVTTPLARRLTLVEKTGIPMPSSLPRRLSTGRRTSTSIDSDMAPPARPRKMSTYEEETY